jgi:phosphate transport system substrate-binding protein
MTDAPGADAYPIAASVFVLMPKAPKAPQRSKAAFTFFRWVLENGQQIAGDLHYVPLPATLVTRIEEYWKGTFPATN